MGHIGQMPVEIARFASEAILVGPNAVICEVSSIRLKAGKSIQLCSANVARMLRRMTLTQVGFNAGHSSAVFLSSNPNSTLYSFDLFELPYSIRSRALFRRVFQGRYHSIKGYSQATLPWFRAAHGAKAPPCNIFSVDGRHDYEGVLSDLADAIGLTRVGGSILADDVSTR